MAFIQFVVTGFFIKSIASFDDTLTRIPILAILTRSKKGKIAFSIGTLLALTLILLVSIFFSNIINSVPFHNQIVAILILALAGAVYFEIFSPKTEQSLQQKLVRVEPISNERFVKLIISGFTISLITLLDDMVVLIPLFLDDGITTIYSIIGVYLAALLQIIIVIYFSKQIAQINYKKEVASAAMVLLAVLVWMGVF